MTELPSLFFFGPQLSLKNKIKIKIYLIEDFDNKALIIVLCIDIENTVQVWRYRDATNYNNVFFCLENNKDASDANYIRMGQPVSSI
ncbi:hypothetical protein H5410_060075 [Solanum commersonii]|uniref:Uncharacterized protein n=1 Tax=Solanum commersonii TaxID=4109 RepID=A0A9J5W446_SOLCO|nr:hypothetical protein H5410_060075 [Solanum commersonii]